MTEIAFQSFDKIPRLFRDMTITEKIDGTNAAIGVVDLGDPFKALATEFQGKVVISDQPDGEHAYCVYAQSRSRLISPGKGTDNYGFAAWAWDNANQLARMLGTGLHFGEWWGLGINRNYGLDHKRFSLFNTHRWGWLANERAREDRQVPGQLHVVPVLAEYTFDTGVISNVLWRLGSTGSQAAPGFMKPEGIVVYHSAGNNLYKATFEMDRHKGELELAA